MRVNLWQVDEITIVYLLTVSLIYIHDATGSGFACPNWFEAWGRKCYYYQGAHTQLSLAEFTCGNVGAIPVLAEDPDEATYLGTKFNTTIDVATHDGFWVRCKDDVVEGQWTCESSSNYWNSDDDHHGFWDWQTGQPDGEAAENCLVINSDGKLQDVPCLLTMSFNAAACEITMVTAAPPTEPQPGYDWYHNDSDNKCLHNHAIDTFETSGIAQCSFECTQRQDCLSFNFQTTNMNTQICTLNSAIRETVDGVDYVSDNGCRYFLSSLVYFAIWDTGRP